MRKTLIPLVLLLLCAAASFADADIVRAVDTSTAEINRIDPPVELPISEIIREPSDDTSTVPEPSIGTIVDSSLAEVIHADTLAGTSTAGTIPELSVDIPADSSLAEVIPAPAINAPADTLICETAVITPRIHTPSVDGYLPSAPKRIKFGRRVAYNNSFVSGLSADIYSFDGETLSLVKHRTEVVHSTGFEVSAILRITVNDAAALKFLPAVLFRKPLSTRYAGVGELAVSFPFFLEWRPYAAVPLYALAGVQPDVPVYTRLMWSAEPQSAQSEPYSVLGERSVADFGVVIGLGGYLNDRLSLDARVVLGMADFDRTPGRRLNQVTLGINYIR
ncbi:MAG: hypothetical protein FWB85_07650 [Chitinispirillia bacterium]|nr:hypothetical protein [Chitinispirillia bacterium]MCL2242146.1 hypothetical protein [Chitinispirillia bacterium]